MPLHRVCLVHYHEIGLKGHNRSSFEKRLVGNIKALISAFPVQDIKRISGRLSITLKPESTPEVAYELAERILGVPGVARVSSGYRCEQELDVMYEVAQQALTDASPFEAFKVAARRNHTTFPHDSMELNQLVGAALCKAFPEKKVQMREPDVVVHVEMIQGGCYVYAHTRAGVGGLPVGSAGKAVCLLSSGIDSPVALWRVARRGAVCVGVHFSGRPETAATSEYLVEDIAGVLEQTGCVARVYVAPIGTYQREIASLCPPPLRIVLYRRFMYRIAEQIALREGAKALVTGESLGQVASQTMENLLCTNAAVSLPVYRPLIGTDKVEIISMAQELGTFEISSQDAPDCCTLFMPRNPETHAKLEDVLAAEADLPLDKWVAEVLDALEVHDYACPSYKPPRD